MTSLIRAWTSQNSSITRPEVFCKKNCTASHHAAPHHMEKFTKWCNNAGFVKQNNFVPHRDAFCHWTYEVMNGSLMVADIQGDGYTLTYPNIHCKDDLFGDTNFGKTGMWHFLLLLPFPQLKQNLQIFGVQGSATKGSRNGCLLCQKIKSEEKCISRSRRQDKMLINLTFMKHHQHFHVS